MMMRGKVAMSLLLLCAHLLASAEPAEVSSASQQAMQHTVKDTETLPPPPPPPGPYISTALTDNARFMRGQGALDLPPEGMRGSPFFSTDMPWPGQRLPQTWMPEEGYRYAPAPAVRPYGSIKARPDMPDHTSKRHHPGQSTYWQPLPPPAKPSHYGAHKRSTETPRRSMSRGAGQYRPYPTPAGPGQRAQAHRPLANAPVHPHMNSRANQPMQGRPPASRTVPPPPAGPWLPLDY